MMEEIQHKIKNHIIKENGISPLNTTTASPDAYSTSDTPTPPNGIHDKNWVSRYHNIDSKYYDSFNNYVAYFALYSRIENVY